MNNFYNGISIIEIDRIRNMMKHTGFLSRMFSPQELKYLTNSSFSVSKVAKMFCGKTAFRKAMGYDFRGCSLKDVSVLTDYVETPYISLSGTAKEKFMKKKCNVTLSISNSKDYAVASVVIFSKE